ncbi:biotin transporter BioY [Antarcticirhabdus aurantiaca]|uniref:Biotin transporter BioY n=1 Tax=Antarcticirhabdus aurantiaca TaxID=2606717 RepID=A0ACD4NRP2_9HYPH|nr:biotin transporter BioY [Antarcticirhabdus aurantiaca]WAJ29616.1 biotin transporter BioY [Jeongeuplla avenae]
MTQATALSPAGLIGARSVPTKILAVGLGTLFLAASSYVEVPMVPVPVTMQTFAVLLIGALYGPGLAFATILAWLGEAALGLPVLSGGAGGLAYMMGPTGGYLLGFALAAPLVGWLAQRGWGGEDMFRSFLAMLAGHAVLFVPGVLWLSSFVGFEQAIVLGFTPFLVGTVLKSALAAACGLAAGRAVARLLAR